MTLTDIEFETLYILYKSGNEDAYLHLIELAYRFAGKLALAEFKNLQSDDRDDIVQRAVARFNHTIARYRFDKDTSFDTYAGVCFKGDMYNYYRVIKRRRHDFQLLSLDAPMFEDESYTMESSVINRIADYDPLVSLHISSYYEQVCHLMLARYTNSERISECYIVFVMTINGCTADDIASVIGKTVRYVYRKRVLFRKCLRKYGMETFILK